MARKIQKDKNRHPLDKNTTILTVTELDIVHFPCKCPIHRQTYVQLTAQLVLLPPYISAANYSHLRGATDVEYMYSLLQRLSNVSGKIFIH
jgi:hypothetical protein